MYDHNLYRFFSEIQQYSHKYNSCDGVSPRMKSDLTEVSESFRTKRFLFSEIPELVAFKSIRN